MLVPCGLPWPAIIRSESKPLGTFLFHMRLSSEASMYPSTELPVDILSQLELQIARRADEIARDRQAESSISLDCWLLAETEVFGEDVSRDVPR